MKTAVLYSRVSSEEQLSGKSIDVQKESCAKWARDNGYQVVGIYEDGGKTGTKMVGRDGLDYVIIHCQDEKIDVALVIDTDRIARNEFDHYYIRNELKKLKEDQEKIKEALHALGVDFDSYSDEEIKEKNKKNVLLVRAGSIQNPMADAFVNASLKSYERLSLMRLMDIISQNWILIRQNELLLRKLDKMLSFFRDKSTK